MQYYIALSWYDLRDGMTDKVGKTTDDMFSVEHR